MTERVVEYDLESCYEETAPPITLKINGRDGKPILEATMTDPTWIEVQRTARKASELEDKMEAEATWIVLCLTEWSLSEVITVKNVLRLHPAVIRALSEVVAEILKVKEGQIKNFVPLSQPNISQPSSAGAANSTTTAPANGPTES